MFKILKILLVISTILASSVQAQIYFQPSNSYTLDGSQGDDRLDFTLTNRISREVQQINFRINVSQYAGAQNSWNIALYASSGQVWMQSLGGSQGSSGYHGAIENGVQIFTINGSLANDVTRIVLIPNVWSNTNFAIFSNICIYGSAGCRTIPLNSDTYNSFYVNSHALRNSFNLQFAKIAQGLTYDCTVYDQKNICVSFAGSKSDGKGFDATTGALIIAHKPTTNFRFGGYIDQSFGSSTSGGLTIKNGNPGFGAFAVWSQNADGSGVQVRAAANVGKVDIETTREAIDSAEAGFGKSNIKSQGFSLEVSKDYAINSLWSARPYVGYRQTTNKRGGYTETDDATAPLTYSSLKQTTETLTAGATFAQTLSAKTTMFVTAGIEHDLKNSIGNYTATNGDIGDIDSINMSSNKTKTRPTVSFALRHDIDKTQRVGVSLTHRKEAFASGSTTSALLQYTRGF